MPITVTAIKTIRPIDIGSPKNHIPKIAMAIADAPVQKAYTVPAGSDFSTKERSDILIKTKMYWMRFHGHNSKPPHFFNAINQSVSPIVASNKSHHANEGFEKK